MKKTLSILLSIVMILSIIGGINITAFAETYGDYTYSVSAGNVSIEGYNGSAQNVTIPSKIDGNNVTSIAVGAFANHTEIKNVRLPDTLTILGPGAFDGCTGISEIILPNGATTIYDGAFNNCTSLKRIYIPMTVTSIMTAVCKGCTNLSEIIYEGDEMDWNNNVTVGGDNALFNSVSSTLEAPTGYCGEYVYYVFESRSGTLHIRGTGEMEDYDEDYPGFYTYRDDIKTIDICSGVSGIGIYAFYGLEKATYVHIDETVKDIRLGAFENCFKLDNVTIPSCVKNIGKLAFHNCNGLATLTIGNGVKTIDEKAFFHCEKLKGVTIPATVTSIGDYAFAYCPMFKDFIIINGVSTIGEYAFYQDNINSLTIPKSVTGIGYAAFMDNKGLSSIKVDAQNTVYDSRDNCNAIIEKASGKLIQGCKNTIVPNGVKVIADSAFTDCEGLTTVILPDGVTEIEGWAFSNCGDLTDVVIPESLTKIGADAFNGASDTFTVIAPCTMSAMVSKITAGTNRQWDAAHVYSDKITAQTATTFTRTYTCNYCSDTFSMDFNKAKNSLTVKGKKATVKYKKLKKKNQKIAITKAIKVSKKQGTLSYSLYTAKKGSKNFKKKFSVNKKTGKITLKKGLKKGSYKVKIKVTASGDNTHKPMTKTVTVTITVK